MKIYEIYGETGETMNYASCVFLVTMDGIYCESKSLGFFKRPDWDIKRLNKHIAKMKREGFTVKEKTLCA